MIDIDTNILYTIYISFTITHPPTGGYRQWKDIPSNSAQALILGHLKK